MIELTYSPLSFTGETQEDVASGINRESKTDPLKGNLQECLPIL